MILALISLPFFILFVYFAIYLVVISRQEKIEISTKKIDVKDVTLVIPYRNEEGQIPSLIESLHDQAVYPYAVIFVDDHSTDKSTEILKRELKDTHLNCELYHLTDDYGKKAALDLAIRHAETDFILQWDADVQAAPTYFEELSNLAQKDLWVLPVSLYATKLKLLFFEWDYTFFHALSYKLKNWKVLTASGANLLFRKRVYKELSDSIKGREHLSGDDYFLLDEMQKFKKDVGVSASKSISISTALPNTFYACMQQRLRWLSKTKPSEKIGLFCFFLFQLYFLMIFFPLGVFAFIPLLLKTSIDVAFVKAYLQKMERDDLYAVPLFFLGSPIYLLLIFFSSFFLPKEWKGRALKKEEA